MKESKVPLSVIVPVLDYSVCCGTVFCLSQQTWTSFELVLAKAGAKAVCKKYYADHHRYSQAELDDLAESAGRADCELAVTTVKDWVKIQHHKLSWPEECDCQLCALDIEMTFNERTRHVLTRELAALFDD